MISGTTALLGLLGEPVSHSLSPGMHNAALKAMAIDWRYLAFPCNKDALKTVLSALRAVGCQGLNVTIPHKQSVAKLCTALTPTAQRIGAVNTLLPNAKGGWIGTNTDVEGFLVPLRKQKKDWGGCCAIVLGCGGSARAVIEGLQSLNFNQIKIIGRRKESLKNFLTELHANHCNSESINHLNKLQGLLNDDQNLSSQINQADLIINTTPVGMTKLKKEMKTNNDFPLGKEIWSALKPNSTLYDLIYTPRPTPWLLWGEQQGLCCIDGLEMLVQQGAASLKLWSGRQDIPIQIMRESVMTTLKI